MRLLAVDVGTGTQDILLFDSDLAVENCFKMVTPSPTMRVARQVKAAARRGQALLLTGVTMGGGPSAWAVRDHAQAGHPVYATPDAARTFNDDLEAVIEMGVTLLSEDEAAALRKRQNVCHVVFRDFDYPAIARAFAAFGLDLGAQYPIDGVAVAVFDHGNAPPGYSDRQFRFDYLTARLQDLQPQNKFAGLTAFAFRAKDVPPIMTRMQAVADSYAADGLDLPLVLMDTAPAAILGALLDDQVGQHERLIAANLGNMHTLAFRLGPEGVEGLFEHHTGLLDRQSLDDLIADLAQGALTHERIFAEHGHGALLNTSEPSLPELVAITGPRRALLRGSRHPLYFATPYGDMMIAGCFGLLRACAELWPEWAEAILNSLDSAEYSAPWEHL